MGQSPLQHLENGAGDEVRTRDPQLGRLMLYQLSYTRFMVVGEGFEPSKATPADLQSAPFDHSGTPPLVPIKFSKNLPFRQAKMELAMGLEPAAC